MKRRPKGEEKSKGAAGMTFPESILRESIFERPLITSNVLKTMPVPAGLASGSGTTAGANLFLHFIKPQTYALEVKQILQRRVKRMIIDYAVDHPQAFIDTYPDAFAGLTAAEQYDPNFLAMWLVERWFQYIYSVDELIYSVIQWGLLLRIDGYQFSDRVTGALKFSTLNRMMHPTRSFLLPPGRIEIALANMHMLYFPSNNNEFKISMPWAVEPGRTRVEFSMTPRDGTHSLGFGTSPNTHRPILLPEMGIDGSQKLVDNASATDKVIIHDAADATDFSNMNANSVGLLARRVMRNLQASIAWIQSEFPEFVIPGTPLRNIVTKFLEWAPDENFDFTTLNQKVREIGFADGVQFARDYMDPHTIPGPISAGVHKYTSSNKYVNSGQGVPYNIKTTSVNAVSDETSLERVQAHVDADPAVTADYFAPLYPWVGFVIKPSKMQEISGFVDSYSRLNGSVEELLKQVADADAAWINYSNTHGNLNPNVAPRAVTGGETAYFFFDTSVEQKGSFHAGFGSRAIRANFRELFGQVIHYSVREGDMMKGIERMNQLHGDFYLDPILAANGIFIPARRTTPVIDTFDPIQTGFILWLAYEDGTEQNYNTWKQYFLSDPKQIGYSAVEGVTNANSAWSGETTPMATAIISSLWDGLVFAGLAPLFTPTESLLGSLVLRPVEASMATKKGTFLGSGTEMLSLLNCNIAHMPVPVSFKPLTSPELEKFFPAALKVDGSSLGGPYVRGNPIIDSTKDGLVNIVDITALNLSDLLTGVDAHAQRELYPVMSGPRDVAKLLLPSSYPTVRRKVPERLLNPVSALSQVYQQVYSEGMEFSTMIAPVPLGYKSGGFDLPKISVYFDVAKLVAAGFRSETPHISNPSGRTGSGGRGRRPSYKDRKSTSYSKEKKFKKPYKKKFETKDSKDEDMSNMEFPVAEPGKTFGDKSAKGLDETGLKS